MKTSWHYYCAVAYHPCWQAALRARLHGAWHLGCIRQQGKCYFLHSCLIAHRSTIVSTVSTVPGQLEPFVHLCMHAPRSVGSMAVQLSPPTKQQALQAADPNTSLKDGCPAGGQGSTPLWELACQAGLADSSPVHFVGGWRGIGLWENGPAAAVPPALAAPDKDCSQDGEWQPPVPSLFGDKQQGVHDIWNVVHRQPTLLHILSVVSVVNAAA